MKLFIFLIQIILVCPELKAEMNRSRMVPVDFPVALKTDNSFEAKKWIPTDMPASQDPYSVMNRLGDRAFFNLGESDLVQTNSVVRGAHNIEKSMRTEMTVAGTDPKKTKHKFSFQFLPMQTVSKAEYKGWLNASYIMDFRAQRSTLEFTDQLWSKELFVNHVVDATNELSNVGLRWKW